MNVLEVARGLVEVAMTRAPVRDRDGQHRPGCLYCGGLGGAHQPDCAGERFLDEASAGDPLFAAAAKGPAGGGVYTWDEQHQRSRRVR